LLSRPRPSVPGVDRRLPGERSCGPAMAAVRVARHDERRRVRRAGTECLRLVLAGLLGASALRAAQAPVPPRRGSPRRGRRRHRRRRGARRAGLAAGGSARADAAGSRPGAPTPFATEVRVLASAEAFYSASSPPIRIRRGCGQHYEARRRPLERRQLRLRARHLRRSPDRLRLRAQCRRGAYDGLIATRTVLRATGTAAGERARGAPQPAGRPRSSSRRAACTFAAASRSGDSTPSATSRGSA